MASKNKSRNFDIKIILLIVYVAACVLMVMVTMGLSFVGTGEFVGEPTVTMTATLSSVIQTLQAEAYQPVDAENHGSGRQNSQHGGTPATTTPIPEITPDS